MKYKCKTCGSNKIRVKGSIALQINEELNGKGLTFWCEHCQKKTKNLGEIAYKESIERG